MLSVFVGLMYGVTLRLAENVPATDSKVTAKCDKMI